MQHVLCSPVETWGGGLVGGVEQPISGRPGTPRLGSSPCVGNRRLVSRAIDVQNPLLDDGPLLGRIVGRMEVRCEVVHDVLARPVLVHAVRIRQLVSQSVLLTDEARLVRVR